MGGGGGEGGLQQVGDLQASAHSVSLGAPPGVSVCVCVRVRVCVCVCVCVWCLLKYTSRLTGR